MHASIGVGSEGYYIAFFRFFFQFANVYKAKDKETGDFVAIKKVSLEGTIVLTGKE